MRGAMRALLVGLVPFAVHGHLAIFGNVPGKRIAELRPSLLFECVDVINAADKKDSLVSPSERFGREAFNPVRLGIDEIAVWSNRSKIILIIGYWQRGKFAVNGLGGLFDLSLVGWGRSIVFQSISDMPASPSYSRNQLSAMSLRVDNRHMHTPPPADLTAFQVISARRWGLITRGSTGVLAPPFTLGAGSAHQSSRETAQRRGSWQRTPA
jgi:hypothetical protein